MRELDGLDRLRERPDLVDLDENRVADAALDPLAQAVGIGDEDVVADELQPPAEAVGQALPAVQSSSAMPSSSETIG